MEDIELNQYEKYIYQEIDRSLLSRTKLRELRSLMIYYCNQGNITVNDTFLYYCEKLGIDLELNYGV